MGHDLAAVEFRQPNLAELQDYTGTVGTERERAGKKIFYTYEVSRRQLLQYPTVSHIIISVYVFLR